MLINDEVNPKTPTVVLDNFCDHNLDDGSQLIAITRLLPLSTTFNISFAANLLLVDVFLLVFSLVKEINFRTDLKMFNVSEHIHANKDAINHGLGEIEMIFFSAAQAICSNG